MTNGLFSDYGATCRARHLNTEVRPVYSGETETPEMATKKIASSCEGVRPITTASFESPPCASPFVYSPAVRYTAMLCDDNHSLLCVPTPHSPNLAPVVTLCSRTPDGPLLVTFYLYVSLASAHLLDPWTSNTGGIVLPVAISFHCIIDAIICKAGGHRQTK